MKILVTGSAGFIGFHTSKRLLERGDEVIGLDNLNDYYDVSLKNARLAQLQKMAGFAFYRMDLADRKGVAGLFASEMPQRVINLAAQAGVRYSIENPYAYVDTNLVGFVNILEGCRHQGVEHLVYASSSSVYGANTTLPFSALENCLGKTAEKNFLPLQPGDVPDTWADVDDLTADVGYRPSTPVEGGVSWFVDWYLHFYSSHDPCIDHSSPMPMPTHWV